jgi:hypothetical protein
LSETFVIGSGRFDLVVTAGSTFPNAFDEAVFYPLDNNNLAFNLTDWHAELQIRDAVTGELALEVTPTIDVVNNAVKFSITADDTSLLVLPNYVWACELKNHTTHKVMTLARGLVEVLPEIVLD